MGHDVREPEGVVLELQGLTKSYGSLRAVDAVSFTVGPGEVFGLLGPNGAGKSTTMKIVAGLLPPDAGSVTIDGHVQGNGHAATRGMLGVAPQELAVYPELTGLENVRFFGSLYGLAGRTLETRVAECLEVVGLTERAGEPVETYSGGMKRRLNFAVSIVHAPRVLLLDEPTVGVDPQSRNRLLECVRGLANEGLAIVYASHYMEEVEAVCERVAIVDRGRIVASGDVPALLAQVDRRLEFVVEGWQESLSAQLSGLDVAASKPRSDGAVTLTVPLPVETANVASVVETWLGRLGDAGLTLRGVRTAEANLERLFLDLTGKRLRD